MGVWYCAVGREFASKKDPSFSYYCFLHSSSGARHGVLVLVCTMPSKSTKFISVAFRAHGHTVNIGMSGENQPEKGLNQSPIMDVLFKKTYAALTSGLKCDLLRNTQPKIGAQVQSTKIDVRPFYF